MATFIYHKDSKTVSCVCGKEIYGEHTCNNILKVKECNGEDCTICKDKEDEDQWYEDRDGYIRCSTCDLKCECDCDCFVDTDKV